MTPKQYEFAEPDERAEQGDIIVFTSPDSKTITNNLIVLKTFPEFSSGKEIMFAKVFDESKKEGQRNYSVDLDCCKIQQKWYVM
jgi:hypothetical protein